MRSAQAVATSERGKLLGCEAMEIVCEADARVDLLTRALSEYLDDDGEPSGHADHLDAKESVF